MSTRELKKILFRLTQDKDGYPPFEFESVWGFQVTPQTYELDNTPYYIYGVSKGDTIFAIPRDNEMHASQLIYKGGHSTLRVFAENETVRHQVITSVTKLGAQPFSTIGSSLLAIDIPPTTSFQEIDDFLSSLSNGNTIAYEDACLQHKINDENRIKECCSLSTIPLRTN